MVNRIGLNCVPRQLRVAAIICAVSLLMATSAWAQNCNFQRQSVGGVFVKGAGVLENSERDDMRKLQEQMQQALQDVPGDLKDKVQQRKVSLRRLEAAIAEQQKAGVPLSDEVRYLAGLQQIQYVFVYPELGDIVLAGPAEGWRVDDQATVVGMTTGRPVMLLDDLLVALRTAEATRQTGISCSIDPTQEGYARFVQLAKSLTTMNASVPEAIEKALGPQKISVTGVPATSHFAHVLVVADYKMKRLAMNFDEAPVKNMPSFLDLMKGGGGVGQNMMPRWWLEPNYQPMLADPDGLAWEIRGAGVKAMTEEDFFEANGKRTHTGKQNPLAKKWADSMTANYDQLAQAEPIFAQLRNCIDLAVVAALIVKEELPHKTGHSFPILMTEATLPTDEYNAPQQVPSQASVLRKGKSFIISASGGVLINPWSIQQTRESSSQLNPLRTKAVAQNKNWWWN